MSLKDKDLHRHEPEPPSLESLLAYEPFVRRIARALVRDEARANDVVQQVWLKAMKYYTPGKVPFYAWLRVVIKEAARKQYRTDIRAQKREQKVAADRAESQDSEVAFVDQKDLRQHLAEHVRSLEEPYRSTVMLHFFEGLTLQEIAKHFDVPASTIRTRLRRALAGLKVKLESRYGDRGNWAITLIPLAISEPSLGEELSLGRSKPVVKLSGAAALIAAALFLPFLGLVSGSETPASVSTLEKEAVAASDSATALEGRFREPLDANVSVPKIPVPASNPAAETDPSAKETHAVENPSPNPDSQMGGKMLGRDKEGATTEGTPGVGPGKVNQPPKQKKINRKSQ